MAKRKRKARRKAGGSLARKAWGVEDRRSFADGNFVRASSIAGRRFAGPTASEWR